MTPKSNSSTAESLGHNDAKPSKEYSDRSSDGSQAPSEAGSIDEAKSPDPTPKFDSAEAIYQARQGLSEAHRWRNDRPLGQLVKAEAELEDRSQALQALSAAKRKSPDEDLLIYQLTHAVNTGRASRTFARKIRRDTLSLFSALASSDVIESILDRHIVTVSNAAMECQARASFAGNAKALDIYLRHAEKMTRVLIDLIESRERRRRPKQVVVGNVNVEAGGQAIVGNIEAHKQRSQSDDGPDDESAAA